MARYVARVDIMRPARVVFDFLDTPENAPRYSEGVISCVQLSGVRKGVGQRVLRMTVAGRHAPIDGTQNITEHVEGSLLRSEGTISWYATYEATTRFEPIEPGSQGVRVTFDYVYRPTVTAILTVVLWPLFVLMMRGRLEKTAATVKRILEAEEAGAYRAAG
jgi:hypothetical protein